MLLGLEIVGNESRCFAKYLREHLPTSLFVFLIGDPKQNVNSFMTPYPDSVFNALSRGSGFAFHGSFFNHSLIGQNCSTANKNLCNGG